MPALWTVIVASLKCLPLTHARNSDAEDLSVALVIWMSCVVVLPEPLADAVGARLNPRIPVLTPPVNDSVATVLLPSGGETTVSVGDRPTVTTWPPASVSVPPPATVTTLPGAPG